ncbi:BspA family leucine-rich repeat surface protein [Marivirga tractuosa]|nr:BspA family leucine-rich repeat surface protein [Marivirga tractuosa]
MNFYKKIATGFALIFMFLSSQIIAQIYVNGSLATGNNDGTTWADAYRGPTALHDALTAALSGNQIWVARGTYLPSQQWELFSGNTTTGDNRLVSFKITDGVKVYGGFLGTETAISQRINFGFGQANETILSGDLAADDNVSNTFPSLAYNNYGENAYHVVYTYGVSSQTLVDGFTITSGAATGTGNAQDGGGWYNSGRPGASAPVIKNVIFYRNTATNGGGIYNWGQFDNAIPTLLNCQFIQNLADAGGGMYNFALSGGSTIPELINTVFYQNSAGFDGGAVYNNGNNFTGTARVEITNCSFFENITTNFSSSGAAIYNLGSSGTGGDDIINIQNSIFWQNTSTDGTGIPYINTWENSNEALLNVSYSLVPETNVVLAGYTGTTIGTGMLYTADPLFVDTDNSDFRLFDNSPAANLANQALLPNINYNFDGTLRSSSVLDYDISGDVRVQNGQLNMGATETLVPPPSILITSISPTSAPVGTEVTISGSMFNPSGPNDIFFGPVKVTANANAAGTEILVNVPAGGSSVTPIIVRNNANGLQASSINSSTPFFTLTVPGPLPLTNTRFSTTQYSSSIQSNTIAAGDFDNDGDVDIIIADRTNTNNVIQFQENDGSGVFSTGANTALASGEVRNLQVADFDGDGNLDIAAGKNGGLELFQGNGDGTFTAFPSPAFFSTIINDKAGLAIADINKDGNMDIITANISDEVSVLLGDGSGNFAHASYSPFIPAGLGEPSALDVADFNNDGFLDIALLDYNNNQGHIMLFNEGADLFDAPISFATGSRPFRLVTGYFNSDTNMDLAILNITSPTVEIYSGDGAGNFTASGSPVAMGSTPFGLNRGNFDGNGTTDIVVGGGNQSNFPVLQGDGIGAVSSFSTFPLNVSPSRPYGVISADFNNDGIADLAGGDLSFAGFTVAIWVRPVITSISPNYANAGETITITGEDFTGVTDVSFGGTPAESYVFVSDTEITAVVAAGSTSGAVAVTTADGTASLDGFMFSPFVTTWVTDNGSIIIPTSGGGYNYDVAWSNLTNPGTGEGSFSGRTGNTTIFGLANTDVYEVRISGVFPRINFGGSTFQNQQKIRSIEQWGNNPWTSMEGAFHSCRNMVINAADTPDLSNVTSLASMFVGVREATAFTNTDLSTWDVSTITDMSYLFNFAWFFNQDISNWDVSSVTNMAYMFGGAYAYNQPLNSWDVSNVVNMELMFFELDDFNQPLDQWDVSNVQFMNGMFSYTKAFDQPLNNWNVSSVTTMQEMFGGAEVFNQPLDLWDVSSVTDMSLMFENANVVAFNQPLDSWDVSNVTQMWSMFSYNDIFNQDISGWDVSNVTDMWSMFRDATAFDQNLGNWDVGNVADMGNMLDNSGLSTANYDATLIGWSSLPSLQPSLSLGALNLNYCTASSERQILTNTPNNWTITDGNAACDTPSPATIISFSNTGLNQTEMSWTNGDGSNRIVIAKAGSIVDANPVDLITYTANASFGTAGTEIGTANYVVYNGNGNSVTVTNLNQGETYYFQVFEYNGPAGLEAYNTDPTASGNPASVTTFMPPSFTSFSPPSAAEGEIVTLSGNNFTGATSVTFGGTPATFTIESDSEIRAEVGSGSSGIVSVTTPGGTSNLSDFIFIPAPVINSFTPASATAGETVIIEGTDFSNVSVILIAGINVTSFNLNSDSEIAAIVPAGGSTAGITVTTPGGTVSITGFNYIATPEIDIFEGATNLATNATLNFDDIVEGASTSKILTIDNPGPDDLVISDIQLSDGTAFTVSGIALPTTIAAQTSADFTLTFSSAVVQSWNDVLSISSNDSDENPFNLNVEGIVLPTPVPEIEVSNASVSLTSNDNISFADLVQNDPSDQVLTITNAGTADLVVSDIQLNNGTAFSITGITLPATIAAGASADFTLTFSSAVVQSWSDVLSISSNDSNENPFNLNIEGTIIPTPVPEIEVSNASVSLTSNDNISFADLVQNDASDQVLTITNAGTADLVVSDIQLTNGTAFSITGITLPATIVAGASAGFTLTFSSAVVQNWSDILSISSNDSDENPFNLNVEGTIIPTPVPEIEVSNASESLTSNDNISFANLIQNDASDQVLTISNSGTADLVVSDIQLTNGTAFSITGITLPATIAAEASVDFTLTFSNAVVQSWNDVLSISSNDSDENPFNLNVAGTIIPTPTPEIEVNNASVSLASNDNISFADLVQNDASDQLLTITNAGSADLVVTDIQLNNGTAFSITGITLPVTIAAGASADFTLTFSSAVVQSWNDVLSISSNDSDENSFNLNLTGTIVPLPTPEIEVRQRSELINGVVQFGTVNENSDVSLSFEILNVGTASLLISEISSSSPKFTSSGINLPLSISAGQSNSFDLRLSTDQVGAFESTISIRSNDPNQEVFSFNVRAVVSGGRAVIIITNPDNSTNRIVISEEDVDLGQTSFNLNIERLFGIENLSDTEELIIEDITTDNPLFTISNIPGSIPAGGWEQFSLTLNSKKVGFNSTTITVTSSINDFSFNVIAEVISEEEPQLITYNLITPNGDGRHDLLFIENISLFPNNTVSIFNRLGNKVFEISNYDNTTHVFEGIASSGQELITGNYYYVIDKGDGSQRISGFLLIKR